MLRTGPAPLTASILSMVSISGSETPNNIEKETINNIDSAKAVETSNEREAINTRINMQRLSNDDITIAETNSERNSLNILLRLKLRICEEDEEFDVNESCPLAIFDITKELDCDPAFPPTPINVVTNVAMIICEFSISE